MLSDPDLMHDHAADHSRFGINAPADGFPRRRYLDVRYNATAAFYEVFIHHQPELGQPETHLGIR